MWCIASYYYGNEEIKSALNTIFQGHAGLHAWMSEGGENVENCVGSLLGVVLGVKCNTLAYIYSLCSLTYSTLQ